MLFQSEVTTARPELDRERARLLFVGVEMEVSLPLARRDQPVGDVAQRHDRAQRAVGDAVLERRGHALLGHRIGAFDDCERGLHFPNAAYQRVNVNLAAGRRDVFGDDAVRKQEGKAAGDAGVYAQDWRSLGAEHPLVVRNSIARGGANVYVFHDNDLSICPASAGHFFVFQNWCYGVSWSCPHRGFTLGEKAIEPLAGNAPGSGGCGLCTWMQLDSRKLS